MKVTLVLHAMNIPTDSTVRKVTGEKLYTLKRSIMVYSDKPELRQKIESNDVVFLVSETGGINAHASTDQFAVDLLIDEAMELLSSFIVSQ